MTRVLALVPDLLFGSRVQELLGAAGHEVTLLASAAAVERQIDGAELLVVDLASPPALDPRAPARDGVALVERLRAAGRLRGVATLGVYAHVEQEVRRRAEAAGFDQVVPRSRMAREGAALVERLSSARRSRS